VNNEIIKKVVIIGETTIPQVRLLPGCWALEKRFPYALVRTLKGVAAEGL